MMQSPKGVRPDIFSFNTLIDGYCKQSKMADALEIVNTMWEHEITPDVITYNTVLNGFCKSSKSDEVMETFKIKAMTEKGFVANRITFNILIENLYKSRKLVKALDILEEMKNNGVSPNVVSFGTLINGFCENEDLDGAYELFKKMEKEYKLYHSMATYHIMINGYSKKLNMSMAEKLFQQISDNGCSPDNYTYQCMIEGFCKVDYIDSGYILLLEKIKKGFIPSLTIFLMVQKGIVPDAMNSIFEVDKRSVAAPKIVIEDLFKKSHFTYYAYKLLHDAVRDKKQ